MSDANRTRVSLVEETGGIGITPAAPAFEAIRGLTSSSLAYTPRKTESQELREDRQTDDEVLIGFEAGGSLPLEVSHRSLETLLRHAMMSAWTFLWAPQVGTITAVNGAGDYTGAAYAAGDVVRFSGFRQDLNNGIKIATSATNFGGAGTSAVEVPPATARAKKVGTQGNLVCTGAPGTAHIDPAFFAAALVPGEWLKVYGLAGNTNNGWVRVLDATGNLDQVPASWTAVTGTAIVFRGDYIRNGTTARSVTIEQAMLDLPVPEYHYYKGQRVASLAINGQSQQLISAGVSFMGTDAKIETVRYVGATDAAGPAFDVMSAASTAGTILRNGLPLPAGNYVMQANVQIDNSLRRKNAYGVAGSYDIGIGRVKVTGTLGTYYGDKTILDDLRKNKNASYNLTYANGNVDQGFEVLLVDLPKVKLSTGDPTVPGVDQDRMLDMNFRALRHPILGYTIHVQQFEGVL